MADSETQITEWQHSIISSLQLDWRDHMVHNGRVSLYLSS